MVKKMLKKFVLWHIMEITVANTACICYNTQAVFYCKGLFLQDDWILPVTAQNPAQCIRRK